MNTNNTMMNKSPLRYPGGKTRACKTLDEILEKYYNLNEITHIVSPFFGGGSFEFYLQNKYGFHIFANDNFTPLYNFWATCKNNTNKELMCTTLEEHIDDVNKDTFTFMRDTIMDEDNTLTQSIMYFIINRCSFSGATLSGGYSTQASANRFTLSSVSRIRKLDLSNIDFYNLDFENFIQQYSSTNNNQLIFLDPPYYLEKKSKLYGKNGSMHQGFDHERLHKILSERTNWIMTYNDCPYIRRLYKDNIILEAKWCYGMNKSKESSEIIILG